MVQHLDSFSKTVCIARIALAQFYQVDLRLPTFTTELGFRISLYIYMFLFLSALLLRDYRMDFLETLASCSVISEIVHLQFFKGSDE